MCNVVVLHVHGAHWVLEQVQVVGKLLGEEDVHLLNHRVVFFIRHPDLEIKRTLNNQTFGGYWWQSFVWDQRPATS